MKSLTGFKISLSVTLLLVTLQNVISDEEFEHRITPRRFRRNAGFDDDFSKNGPIDHLDGSIALQNFDPSQMMNSGDGYNFGKMTRFSSNDYSPENRRSRLVNSSLDIRKGKSSKGERKRRKKNRKGKKNRKRGKGNKKRRNKKGRGRKNKDQSNKTRKMKKLIARIKRNQKATANYMKPTYANAGQSVIDRRLANLNNVEKYNNNRARRVDYWRNRRIGKRGLDAQMINSKGSGKGKSSVNYDFKMRRPSQAFDPFDEDPFEDTRRGPGRCLAYDSLTGFCISTSFDSGCLEGDGENGGLLGCQ